jgi:hypothetical protein
MSDSAPEHGNEKPVPEVIAVNPNGEGIVPPNAAEPSAKDASAHSVNDTTPTVESGTQKTAAHEATPEEPAQKTTEAPKEPHAAGEAEAKTAGEEAKAGDHATGEAGKTAGEAGKEETKEAGKSFAARFGELHGGAKTAIIAGSVAAGAMLGYWAFRGRSDNSQQAIAGRGA